MNYRHAFHAGNHADVLKHAVLARILALMARKDTAYAYVDTHAGVGLYDLHQGPATRTGEWLQGIQCLWQAPNAPEAIQDYLQAVRSVNPTEVFRHYPGSPRLAQVCSRPQDRLHLNEKHPEDGQQLKELMRADRRVAVHLGDGWQVPRALLPTPEKRVVLLIDPPFEASDELQRCVQALNEALSRVRQTVGIIWYPIKDEAALQGFYRALSQSKAPKLLRAELWAHPPTDPNRLNGSGLAIANPPWGLEDDLKQLLPWLSHLLAQSQGGWRLDWLIEESSSPNPGPSASERRERIKPRR